MKNLEFKDVTNSITSGDDVKILFLDVDGVLNTFNDWNTLSIDMDIRRINRTLVDRLLGVVEQTACKIVLSSTWRLDEESIGLLTRMRIDIHSATGPAEKSRGLEIKN